MKRTHPKHIQLNRRRFLKLGAFTAAAGMLPLTAFAHVQKAKPQEERSLSIYCTHTGESIETVYWAEGRYVADSLANINYVLRDYRTGDLKEIDARVLDLLHRMSTVLQVRQPIHVVSAYRSLATNNMLAERGERVARHSLHIEGMAVDIRIPNHDLRSLRQFALTMQAGGVGYYPVSNFVHLDVGPVRSWVG